MTEAIDNQGDLIRELLEDFKPGESGDLIRELLEDFKPGKPCEFGKSCEFGKLCDLSYLKES